MVNKHDVAEYDEIVEGVSEPSLKRWFMSFGCFETLASNWYQIL